MRHTWLSRQVDDAKSRHGGAAAVPALPESLGEGDTVTHADLAAVKALCEGGVDDICETCQGEGTIFLGKSDESDDCATCEDCDGTTLRTLVIAEGLRAFVPKLIAELERLTGLGALQKHLDDEIDEVLEDSEEAHVTVAQLQHEIERLTKERDDFVANWTLCKERNDLLEDKDELARRLEALHSDYVDVCADRARIWPVYEAAKAWFADDDEDRAIAASMASLRRSCVIAGERKT